LKWLAAVQHVSWLSKLEHSTLEDTLSLSGLSRRTLIRKNDADRFDPCGRTATPDTQQLISAQQKVHNSLSESSSRISILQVKSTMEKRTGVSVGLAAAARLSSSFPGFDHNRSTAGTVALRMLLPQKARIETSHFTDVMAALDP
jgi:hypothetical protein